MYQHFYGHRITQLLAAFHNQQVTYNHFLNSIVYGYKKPSWRTINLGIFIKSPDIFRAEISLTKENA